MNTERRARFDVNEGKRMVDAFFYTSGVPCRLYTERGELLYEQGMLADSCALCRNVTRLTGRTIQCDKIHMHGALQAERFGGRYIYLCPFDMTYVSSPIMVEGILAGALVAGPVLILDIDEYVDDFLSEYQIEPGRAGDIRRALDTIVRMEPARLNYLSEQLFANAVYISDSSHEMFLAHSEHCQQNIIGEYMQMLKIDGRPEPYPIEKEQALEDAVSQGDKAATGKLLNEILGHILISTGNLDMIRRRTAELLIVVSRAAIRGGSNPEQILDFTHRSLGQLRWMNSQGDVTCWMASVLSQFTDRTLELSDSKHKNSIYKALEYIQANYARKLTLAETAEYAGYSPTYFSRVFREEMKCTFQEYLNEFRVEKSKSLLLSSTWPIAEVCELVGFEDQSYFGKVFRKVTGVTPDRYRKRARRIDTQREFGTRQG